MASAAPPSYKAILLGDPCVGKSSLFLRLQKGVFVKTDELATIGVDYLEKDIDVGDKTIRVCSLLVRRVRSLIIVFFFECSCMYTIQEEEKGSERSLPTFSETLKLSS